MWQIKESASAASQHAAKKQAGRLRSSEPEGCEAVDPGQRTMADR
jgi:hypothetical protein